MPSALLQPMDCASSSALSRMRKKIFSLSPNRFLSYPQTGFQLETSEKIKKKSCAQAASLQRPPLTLSPASRPAPKGPAAGRPRQPPLPLVLAGAGRGGRRAIWQRSQRSQRSQRQGWGCPRAPQQAAVGWGRPAAGGPVCGKAEGWEPPANGVLGSLPRPGGR